MRTLKGLILMAVLLLAGACALVFAMDLGEKPDCAKCGGFGPAYNHAGSWACRCHKEHNWCTQQRRCIPIQHHKPKYPSKRKSRSTSCSSSETMCSCTCSKSRSRNKHKKRTNKRRSSGKHKRRDSNKKHKRRRSNRKSRY